MVRMENGLQVSIRTVASETPATSSSSTRPLIYTQIPELPGIPAPPVLSSDPQADAQLAPTTHFSTVQSEVRAGAIRIEVGNPEQRSPGETAILRNQDAKKYGIVWDIGSLIFETPIQYDYEAGVKVRSLLSTELGKHGM